ncbi:alpha/beta fold hydrolase [Methylibium sp.]|uniref:alpha/beta fold hydrolase n=1 Tax=Methylibium sp. TaxID=2067992 RepID=UPI003D11660C
MNDGRGRRKPGAIVFSHANGFPAGTYRLLFEHWRAAGYAVHAVEKFGHVAAYPVTSNWPHLRDELIHFAERTLDAPGWFVGHSLGGFLSVLAAARRPDLARGVVLLDSPIISGWKARALQLAKATGIGERFTPAAASKRRRQHWPSAQAAFEHFASKPVFARWQAEVLRDYIAAGTEPAGSQRTLSFQREVETEIYRTLPHHLPRVLRAHPLACPVAFIGGTASAEVRQVGLHATERLAQGRVSWIEGGHLFPMERPQETAEAVLAQLRSLACAHRATG